jgi:hypothetical protein
VLATGNHFLLDILGGAACVSVAYAVVHVLGRVAKTVRSHPEPAGAV